jgi:LIVCS family branched-chain amino acid:cation transporter
LIPLKWDKINVLVWMSKGACIMYKRFKIICATGLAMFSMFFGAGNVVFPLDLGRVAGNMNFYAIMGLLITAVFVPFMGVIAMFLFEGDYKAFFNKIGTTPGIILTTFLMCIIGPFVAIPRCISLSYSTLNLYFPHLSLMLFSVVATLLVFFLTKSRGKILGILGYVLAPTLVISLVVVIIKGLTSYPGAITTDYTPEAIFFYGLKEGYFTLDLMAAFFFSVVILIGLRRSLGKEIDLSSQAGKNELMGITLKSTLLGGGLIGFIYCGFSYVASFYSSVLHGVEKDTILSVISPKILGPIGGVVANSCVILACLTTAITLSAVFAEFVQNQLFKKRLNYLSCLLITLVIALFFANLGFIKILEMSKPVLYICYPVLIFFTLLNIASRLFGFPYVKIPTIVAFVISIIWYFV